MSLTLLAAPRDEADDEDHDKDFGFSGYGRFEDDDFAPIQPEGVKDGRLSWTRTANLQSIERMTETARARDASDADSRFDFEVAFYGPGGELIPTER